MTGLVTNGLVTDPTAAAFYAHTVIRDTIDPELARDWSSKRAIDIVLGGGAADFLPRNKGGDARDERDLFREVRGSGYDVVQTPEELEADAALATRESLRSFRSAELAFADQTKSRGGDQPRLSDMVRRGIELLQFNSGGYLLVVDAASHADERRERIRWRNGRWRKQWNSIARSRSAHVMPARNRLIIVCGDVAIGGHESEWLPRRAEAAARFARAQIRRGSRG